MSHEFTSLSQGRLAQTVPLLAIAIASAVATSRGTACPTSHNTQSILIPYAEINIIDNNNGWWAPPTYLLLRRGDGYIHDWLPVSMVKARPYRSDRGTWIMFIKEDRHGREPGIHTIECESLWVWETENDPEVQEQAEFPVRLRVPFW
jgi:hypothetical protein